MKSLLAILLLLGVIAVPAFAKTQPPLTQPERTALVAAIKKVPAGQITVACGNLECRRLAIDIETIFGVLGWQVTPVHKGGTGIDGVHGIRVSGCGYGPEKFKSVVEEVTPRKVDVVRETDCADNDKQIYLVIGPAPD